MEAELLLYTEEQEEKIKRLRAEAERERENSRQRMKNTATRHLKESDPVFVTFDGKTISGHVFKVRTEKRKVIWTNSLSVTREFTVYDVKTPLGEITVNQSWEFIRKRFVEDLSNVEIPEALKKVHTRELLAWRRPARTGHVPFTIEQIKAELALRPHIKTKGELKKFTAFKKKRNK